MKIAVFGGSFNPIHIGHLIIASYSVSMGKMDKVIFLPSGHHPFKEDSTFVSPELRMDMIQSSIMGHPKFEASDYELRQRGITYTSDSMSYFRSQYPEDTLYFIIGYDLLSELERWHKLEELSQKCKFLVLKRVFDEMEHISELVERLQSRFGSQFEFVSSPFVTVSSSEIRRLAKEGHLLKYLVTDGVSDIIIKNGLYRSHS